MRRLILACAFLVGACSTAPTARVHPSNTHYHDDISLTGRLSVSYQQQGKPQALQGKFNWDQTTSATHITLYTPLGQTIAQIVIEPDRAMLQQSGEALRIARDVSALTTDTLGWPLPVTGLKEWLQGFYTDAQGKKSVTYGDNQTHYHSDGWEIRYLQWQDDTSTVSFPKRIDLKHQSKHNGEITLKIVIDSWTLK